MEGRKKRWSFLRRLRAWVRVGNERGGVEDMIFGT